MIAQRFFPAIPVPMESSLPQLDSSLLPCDLLLHQAEHRVRHRYKSLLRAVNTALSSLSIVASTTSGLWLSLSSRPRGTSRAHQCRTSILSLELCHSGVASLIFCDQSAPALRVLGCPCGVCVARKLSFTCDSSVTGPQQNQAEAPRSVHWTLSPFQ
jgi:hypothetical protein